MSLTRLNSRWALVFLTSSLHTWLVSLDSSQVACLSLISSSALIHAGLLPPLLDFLLIRMDHSWAWRRWFLYNNQLSQTPFPFRAISHGILPRRALKSKDFSPEFKYWDLILSPSPSSDPEAVQDVPTPNQSFLICKYQVQKSTSSSCLLDYLVMNLLAMHSRNLLDCLCPALTAAAGCFQGLWTWPLPIVWRKHHLILKSVCRTVVSPAKPT